MSTLAPAMSAEEGATSNLGTDVDLMTEASVCSPSSTSRIAGSPFATRTPSPWEALDCASMSTSSTFSPDWARFAARLIAVVVLPTPPFWLAIA